MAGNHMPIIHGTCHHQLRGSGESFAQQLAVGNPNGDTFLWDEIAAETFFHNKDRVFDDFV